MKPPSVPLMAAVSRPVWVCTPAAQEVVDRFGFSALAPVRPTIALFHTPRCPRRFGHRLLLLRRWLCNVHRRMPKHLSGTPCRTARRNESWAIPSLCRATPSAASEHFLGLLDSRQSLRLRRFLRFLSTEVPFLHQHYPASSVVRTSPPPHTARPGSRELPVDPDCDHRWGFPCCFWSLLPACRRQYPGRFDETCSFVPFHQHRPSLDY